MLNPIVDGMKVCKRGHRYDPGRVQCPECSREYLQKPEVKERRRKNHRKYLQKPGVKELRREWAQQPEVRLSTLKRDACKRGYEVDLTIDQYMELVQPGKCHYDGKPLPMTGHCLDRKDNSKGYTLDNCVPSCWDCNKTKGDNISYNEMKLIGKLRMQQFDDEDFHRWAEFKVGEITRHAYEQDISEGRWITGA